MMTKRILAKQDDGNLKPERQAGYVLPMTALLLIPMMIFAAFAVDIGSWYQQASEQQRTADAAALAAVVWMPDTDKATLAAVEVAAQNGYVAYAQQTDAWGNPRTDASGDPIWDTSTGNASIVVEQIDSQAVRVRIEAKGEIYFGGVVLDEDSVDIARYAVAEYILPVPMGNPNSSLGTGDLGAIGGAENMWLAVNAYCSGRDQGDVSSAMKLGASYTCAGTNNPQYNPDGYFIIVDFPANSTAQSYAIEFYQPGICDRVNEVGQYTSGKTGAQLHTALYKADSTQLDDFDNVRIDNLHGTPISFSQTDCSGWSTSRYIVTPSDPRGRWVLKYGTNPVTSQYRLNYFSIRVTPVAAPGVTCSTLNGNALDTCPRVYARQHLPIYILSTIYNTSGNVVSRPFSSGESASFFLAEIGEEHRGKTLELELYDPGEGMDNLQVVGPNFERAAFRYSTVDCGEYGVCDRSDISERNNESCHVGTIDAVTPSTGTYPCLDVTNTRFNGRTARIHVAIPDNYTCSVVNGCWWRIRYEPGAGATVTDRTTWSVRVIGDPVRLTE